MSKQSKHITNSVARFSIDLSALHKLNEYMTLGRKVRRTQKKAKKKVVFFLDDFYLFPNNIKFLRNSSYSSAHFQLSENLRFFVGNIREPKKVFRTNSHWKVSLQHRD